MAECTAPTMLALCQRRGTASGFLLFSQSQNTERLLRFCGTRLTFDIDLLQRLLHLDLYAASRAVTQKWM